MEVNGFDEEREREEFVKVVVKNESVIFIYNVLLNQ